ncbi:OPT superfamily [Hanseniaspora osmophila]
MSDLEKKAATTVDVASKSTDDNGSSSKDHYITEEKPIEFITSIKSYSDEQVWHLLKVLNYDDVKDLNDLPPEVEFLGTKVHEITIDESLEIMKDAIEYHDNDPNIDEDQYQAFIKYAEEGVDPNNEVAVFELKALAVLLRDHSPYPEVRAVCPPAMMDDPTIPIETFRAYFFALLWLIFSAGFNELFSHRLVSISISTSVIQMFLYPMGKFWERWIPSWGFSVRGHRFALNIDTPWTDKEQMFCTLIIAISMGTFYTSYNILTQKIYYGQDVSFGYQFWLSLSVQFMGFGFAGILRRFVVYPVKAVWPTSLSTIALNKALLTPEDPNEKGISRYTFFFSCMIFMFIYTWFPTFIFNALNTFNWMSWIAPNNWNLAAITGGVSGVGINPIASFDWNVITSSSLLTPWFSMSTQYAGSFLAIIITIACYYTNYQNTKYLPIYSNSLFTNTGEKFKVKNILNSDYQFDEAKYQAYSPPFYSAGNLVCYGCFIATYPFLITYYLIMDHKMFYGAFKDWFGALWAMRKKDSWISLWRDEARALDNFRDPHSRAMARYKEVPDWWFIAVLLLVIIVAICTIEEYHTSTPVWTLFMSLGFNFVFLIPLAILQATAGVSLGLNLLIEMIMGYALPGNPMALMIIKAFGYNIDGQADSYVSNLKLAHYCKIAPVALFRGQLIMAFIQIFINLGVINWSIDNFKEFCQPTQKAKFTCPDIQTYYNASVMWGGLGPTKIFNDVYPILKWCWLIGFLLGGAFGFAKKFGGRYYPTWFNPVIFMIGMLIGPPYGLMYYTPPLIMCFFSQWYAKKYHLRLWEKYNYVLAAAFNAGLVLSSIVIFFAVQYKDRYIDWWGNNVPYAGQDGLGEPLWNITATAKGYFGAAPGHYP